MSSEQQLPRAPKRRLQWRYFVQFSLRSLLMLITAAAVGCWWFLKPQSREERLGQTALVLRREIRLMKVGPTVMFGKPHQLEIINGQWFDIINVGRWQVFGFGRDLLVDGQYANGKEQGKWTIYHVNGRKAVEGMTVQGEKVGRWRAWDEEGRLINEVVYAAREIGSPRGRGD